MGTLGAIAKQLLVSDNSSGCEFESSTPLTFSKAPNIFNSDIILKAAWPMRGPFGDLPPF